MTKNKDKQIRGLMKSIMVLVIGILFFGGWVIWEDNRVDKLEQQLELCQEKVPVRELVFFIKCDDGTLQNVLVDKDNKSLYDYHITQGCEVIE